jgi:hypothetical protein
MQTVIKAADAADFLALVPALAGFHPRRSLALVLFRKKRTAGVMRLDLPTDTDPVDRDAYASTAIGLACKVPDVDGVAVVVYTDAVYRSAGDDPLITGSAIVDALETHAHACGLRLVDALCVASDAWGSYLDPDLPPEGRPLTEISSRAADLPLPAPAEDQGTQLALPVVGLAQKERVARALRAIEDCSARLLCDVDAPPPTGGSDRRGRPGSVRALDPRAIVALEALDDIPQLFEDALTSSAEDDDPFASAALIWCLIRPALRDVALSQWCDGIEAGDLALAAQLEWQRGADYPEDGARRFLGEGPRPDPARLKRARDLVRVLAACTPRDLRPGPLAALGWLSWALGQSSHAAWYSDRALEIDPEHGMSQIVRTLVHAGHLPEWAFERA